MNIQDLSKTKLALWSNLGSSKQRAKTGLFSVEGMKCVFDTIRHFNLKALVVTDEIFNKPVEIFSSFLSDPTIITKTFRASDSQIKKLSNLTSPPDIIALFEIPQQPEIPEKLPSGPILVLDGVRDPGNMGTIIRTAHWFGIEYVFCSHDCVDIFNPKCIQSTMGSIAALNVIYTDLEALFKRFPQRPVCGLLLNGENIFHSDLPQNSFILMGNEGTGISAPIRQLVTLPLTIPPGNPESHPESLNVAIATAVTLTIFKSPNFFN